MIDAVAGLGVLPNAVRETGTCRSLIDSSLPPRAGGPPEK